jgi:hypothetical protein
MARTLLTALAVATLLLTGCSTEGPTTVTTIDKAKAELFTVQEELLAYVTPLATSEPDVSTDSGTLLDCAGGYVWPGTAQVPIDASTDTDAILDEIAAEWAARDGWTTTWDETSKARYLTLTRDDGLKFALGPLNDNTIFDVASFSTCFALDDFDPNARY